jgi:hypothetical protein
MNSKSIPVLCVVEHFADIHRINETPLRSAPNNPRLQKCVVDATNLNITVPLIDPVTMSSTSPANAPVSFKASLPVDLLPTDLARIISKAHPALLLSAYYLRFPALVADPVPTLLKSLFPLALIQIAWAVICLPAVGTSSKPVKKAKPGASKKTMEVSSSKSLVSSN